MTAPGTLPAPDAQRLVAVLMTHWEAEGNIVGVDTWLKVRSVLRALPSDTPVERLKTLLAPILADHEAEQDAFYRLFDDTLDRMTAEAAAFGAVAVQQQREAARRRWRQRIDRAARYARQVVRVPFAFFATTRTRRTLGLLLLAAVLLPAGWLARRYLVRGGGPREARYTHTVAHNRFDGPTGEAVLRLDPDDPVVSVRQLSGSLAFRLGQAYVDAGGRRLVIPYEAMRNGRDTVHYRVCFVRRPCANIAVVFLGYFLATPERPLRPPPLPAGPVTTPAPAATVPPAVATALDTQNRLLDPARLDRQLGRHGTSTSWTFGQGESYFSWWKALIVALVAAAVWLFGIWRQHRGERFALRHGGWNDAPAAWTLRVPLTATVSPDKAFYTAVAEMRRKSLGEVRRLDVPRTIRATVARAGMLDLRYRLLQRSRDYLVLLDLGAPQNHRTKLLELLMLALREHEAPLELFYYDGDPQTVRNARYPDGIALTELGHRYGGFHLVVIGSADALLDGTRHAFAAWTPVLDAWRRRAILSTRPVADWGAAEATLATRFHVLPAAPVGLAALVEALETLEPRDHRLWIERAGELPTPVFVPPHPDAATLYTILGETLTSYKHDRPDDRLVRWVAACALPDAVLWEWTLYVGQLLSSPGEHYLTVDHLFQLTRLPWFISGKMPDDVRRLLIDWLEEHHPAWLIRLRAEWQQVLELEENLPPAGSMAWHGHRVQILLNRLLQKPPARQRKRLESELELLLQARPASDAMVVHYLEQRRAAAPLDHALSDRFRKFVQENRGIRWHWRRWTWQIPTVLTTVTVTLLVHHTQPVTTYSFADYVTALALSPDNRSVLVGHGAGGLGWVRTDGRWVMVLRGGQGKLVSVAWSDERQLIGAVEQRSGTANLLQLWNTAGQPVDQLELSPGLATCAAFSAGFDRLLIGYYDGQAELWDVPRRRLLRRFTHPDAVLDLAFYGPGDDAVLSACRDGKARLWASAGEPALELAGHTGPVLAVAGAPGTDYIATGSRDNTAKLWRRDGTLLHTLKGHRYDVGDVAFSPDGRWLLTASGDHMAKLWSVQDGTRVRTFVGHRDAVNCAAFATDGARVATGDKAGKVKVWELGN